MGVDFGAVLPVRRGGLGKQAQLRKYPENVSGGAAPFAL